MMLQRTTGNVYKRVPSSKWKEIPFQQEFLKKIGESLGFQKVIDTIPKFQPLKDEDFYKLKKEDVRKFGGSGLLRQYNNSIIDMVMKAFPNKEWKKWKFSDDKPPGYWIDIQNQKEFFEGLAKDLKFEVKVLLSISSKK